MTPNAFARAVRALQTDRIDERTGTLTLFCMLPTAEDREQWLALAERPPEFIDSVSIVLQGSDLAPKKGQSIIDGEKFRITVRKRALAGEVRFLLVDGLHDNSLKALSESSIIRIAEMETQHTFATQLARFESWTIDPGASYAASQELSSPQKLVRDLTGEVEVVPDIRPWILRTRPTVSGRAYAAWNVLACRRLLAALANEVSVDNDITTYVLSGPPKRTLTKPAAFDEILWGPLQEAASWVYYEGRDPEARHLLFTNELARAHEPNDLPNVLRRSLESAKSAYDAHVKSGSRETLKALADLRKAVFEETQKISQRAQDLAGSLWKDVAIAAAPFVLKIVSDASKANEAVPNILAIFPIAAAIFLTFSYCIQVYVNYRFFKHQDTSREIWKRALNVALSYDELNQLSETPIKQSLRDYRWVRLWVGVVYVILIAILLKVGYDHVPQDWWNWLSHAYDRTKLALYRVYNPLI